MLRVKKHKSQVILQNGVVQIDMAVIKMNVVLFNAQTLSNKRVSCTRKQQLESHTHQKSEQLP